MKNKLFACDLDNTLIHSYKYRTDDDICIEIYAGREQSFISRQAVELLREVIVNVEFVPVTTRSIEQYRRINWLDGIKPTYAVTSNGANLLYNDVVDSNWRRFFLDGINLYREELNLQFKALSLDKRFSVCRIVDDSFLFLKCIENVNLEETANTLPQIVNKGEALKLLQKKLSPAITFCAGDSIIDLPMLNLADKSYFKPAIKRVLTDILNF